MACRKNTKDPVTQLGLRALTEMQKASAPLPEEQTGPPKSTFAPGPPATPVELLAAETPAAVEELLARRGTGPPSKLRCAAYVRLCSLSGTANCQKAEIKVAKELVGQQRLSPAECYSLLLALSGAPTLKPEADFLAFLLKEIRRHVHQFTADEAALLLQNFAKIAFRQETLPSETGRFLARRLLTLGPAVQVFDPSTLMAIARSIHRLQLSSEVQLLRLVAIAIVKKQECFDTADWESLEGLFQTYGIRLEGSCKRVRKRNQLPNSKRPRT